MPPPTWTGRAKFYYPRLVWNAVTIDFVNPVHIPEIPTEMAVQGQNTSLNGFQETLFIRDEHRVHLLFRVLSTGELQALRAYWNGWGKYGRQATLTLDRSGTCAGQYEYDVFNTFFTRAECLQNPYAPTRTILGDTIYTYDVVFRQGRAL